MYDYLRNERRQRTSKRSQSKIPSGSNAQRIFHHNLVLGTIWNVIIYGIFLFFSPFSALKLSALHPFAIRFPPNNHTTVPAVQPFHSSAYPLPPYIATLARTHSIITNPIQSTTPQFAGIPSSKDSTCRLVIAKELAVFLYVVSCTLLVVIFVPK